MKRRNQPGARAFAVVRGLSLSRRTFLRGAGALVALPLLDAMCPALARAGDAPAAPRRLLFVYAPNGKYMPDWTPSAEGADFALPALLEPLAPLRRHVQVLSGLDLDTAHAHGDGPGDHARATACFLTGVHPLKTPGPGLAAGISADQVAARALATATRFASLELGLENGRASGACDSGYACAYSNSISWRSSSTPNASEVDPSLVFDRLFGADDASTPAERAARRRDRGSVLDAVQGDARRLAGDVGAADRRRLDEFLTGVRELEERIARIEREGETESAQKAVRPKGVPRDYRDHVRAMADLLVLAFSADLTRVATLMFGNAGSNRSYPFIGVSEGHHTLSHHGGDAAKIAKIRDIDRLHVTEFAGLLERFSRAADGDATLLDRSMVVYGSGIGDGNRHNHDHVPILLAGGGDGTLAPGRHVVFPRGTPVTNLYLALLDRMGVRVSRHGDSTAHLTGI